MNTVYPVMNNPPMIAAPTALSTIARHLVLLLLLGFSLAPNPAQASLDTVLNPFFTWTTGGDAPWIAVGQSSQLNSYAKSGTIGPGQSSWIETTITTEYPAALNFHAV